jgi:hypothetical protein
MVAYFLCLLSQIKGIDSNAMPPTKPGLNGRKFHFVPAASKTSLVSIFTGFKILLNLLKKAILMSRWEFSITLEASTNLIDDALCVPAVMTGPLNSST